MPRAGNTFLVFTQALYRAAQKNQTHTPGSVSPDQHGDRYSYVQFRQAVSKGEVVRDATHALLTGSNSAGTVSSTSPIGDNFLRDTGAFDDKSYYRGAWGYINAGAGAGQLFRIEKVVDDDTIQIKCVADKAGNKRASGEGWVEALNNTSTYLLAAPGRVYKTQDNATSDIVRGVAVYDVPSSQVGHWGLVKQTGRCMVQYDVSGDNIGVGGKVQLSQEASGSAGKIEGGSAGIVIGTSLFNDPGLTGNPLVPVWLEINNPFWTPAKQEETDPVFGRPPALD